MDQNLTFNVAQLLKETVGATRSATVVAELYRLAPDLGHDTEAADQPHLQGHVRLLRTDAGVLVRGQLDGAVDIPCSRCLAPVPTPLRVELDELDSQTVDVLTGKPAVPEDDDQALWIDEHHILDLREVLRQDVLITLPMHLLCREDCRGLCPTCGQDLNEGPCNCTPETDPRWAGLAALLKNNESSD